MKVIKNIGILLILVLSLFACDTNNSDDSDNNGDGTDAEYCEFMKFYIIIDGRKYYAMKTFDDADNHYLSIPLDYGKDVTNSTIGYILSYDTCKVYVDDTELLSEQKSFDLTNNLVVTIKASNGESKEYTVKIDFALNTEARLYSLSVLVYNSSSGLYDLEYPCSIDEVNKKVSVNISDKNKSNLQDVQFKYIISDNAKLFKNGSWKESEKTSVNIADYVNNLQIRITAENTFYYTDYQMTVDCLDCNL